MQKLAFAKNVFINREGKLDWKLLKQTQDEKQFCPLVNIEVFIDCDQLEVLDMNGNR